MITLSILLGIGLALISGVIMLLLIAQNKLKTTLEIRIQELIKQQQSELQEQRMRFDEHQFKTLKMLQDSLQQGFMVTQQQVTDSLTRHSESMGKRVDSLTETTDKRLQLISGQVEKRLSEGFEKTNTIFNNVIERLGAIDQAQKKITELSSNVVNLQEVLTDKRSRGAFGEVQLTALIRNLMPENAFSLQHTLSNSKRADCILFLPAPTGNVVIDAKFPLESYQKLILQKQTDNERKQTETQFRRDIRKHIQDIAEKYIIQDETADGAVMFIPAEAIFAEIHANFTDLVDYAHQQNVWLVSPTTMMAILTTARAVLKDAATRKQVHIIQQHLIKLGEDFGRFQERMDNLARHIQQANQDVEQVHKSSQKISTHFRKIERVELEALE